MRHEIQKKYLKTLKMVTIKFIWLFSIRWYNFCIGHFLHWHNFCIGRFKYFFCIWALIFANFAISGLYIQILFSHLKSIFSIYGIQYVNNLARFLRALNVIKCLKSILNAKNIFGIRFKFQYFCDFKNLYNVFKCFFCLFLAHGPTLSPPLKTGGDGDYINYINSLSVLAPPSLPVFPKNPIRFFIPIYRYSYTCLFFLYILSNKEVGTGRDILFIYIISLGFLVSLPGVPTWPFWPDRWDQMYRRWSKCL